MKKETEVGLGQVDCRKREKKWRQQAAVEIANVLSNVFPGEKVKVCDMSSDLTGDITFSCWRLVPRRVRGILFWPPRKESICYVCLGDKGYEISSSNDQVKDAITQGLAQDF